MPLIQQELADTMGMSLVHMNRTLQGLRSRELITTNGHTITVENPRALMKFAAFDPLYLHQQAHKFRSLMQAKVAQRLCQTGFEMDYSSERLSTSSSVSSHVMQSALASASACESVRQLR
ncbi:winged helix-turn-helix domain-containing protein [Mesorhizobium sp. B2-5-9]|nr:winged helix-turn-helix domain-containing protein [Mesorhizobium sp. B2-5-9]